MSPLAAFFRDHLHKWGAQQDLAAALGVDKSTVTKWTTGRSTPTPSRWGDIERALGVNLGTIAQLMSASPRAVPSSDVVDRLDALEAEMRIVKKALAGIVLETETGVQSHNLELLRLLGIDV